jgi:hypothetical protein
MNTNRTYYAVCYWREARVLASGITKNRISAVGETPEGLATNMAHAHLVFSDYRVLVREGDVLRRATEAECERIC